MAKAFSILYLDDEADNLVSFQAVFRRFYQVHLAANAVDALEILARNDIDLVISDQRMPRQTGVEFLEQVHRLYPDTVRMILTGYSDMQAIIDAINKGKIYHYITKPWKMEELRVILDHALETYVLKRKNRQLEDEKKELQLHALRQEKEHIASQYEVLKNQINPHFLFNCLNTLASLIGSDQQRAIQFTNRFARMYRQLLEYGGQALIPLSREMELVDNYMFLQKIRFGDNLSIDAEIRDMNYTLPPFGLQLLVENAIKHNIISDASPLVIRIKPVRDTLEISNAISARPAENDSTGIGLKNLSRRYRIISGKEIAIQNDGSTFTVIIPLIPDA